MLSPIDHGMISDVCEPASSALVIFQVIAERHRTIHPALILCRMRLHVIDKYRPDFTSEPCEFSLDEIPFSTLDELN